MSPNLNGVLDGLLWSKDTMCYIFSETSDKDQLNSNDSIVKCGKLLSALQTFFKAGVYEIFS